MELYSTVLSEVESQAASLGLEGVVADSLCQLLAYSIYKNQLIQYKGQLEASFSTSTLLNSRLHHASNLLYSTYRGSCSRFKCGHFKSLISNSSFKKLDYLTTYNSYKFYFEEDLSVGDASGGEEFNLYCSTGKVTSTLLIPDPTALYIDIPDTNISENINFYKVENSVSTNLSFTTDIARLYNTSLIDGEYVFDYDYLIITITDYGIRIIRRPPKYDVSATGKGYSTTSWDTTVAYKVDYLVYTENSPDVTNFISLPSFQPSSDSYTSSITKLSTTSYIRESDKDQIYFRSIENFQYSSFMKSTSDLEAKLGIYFSDNSFSVYVGKAYLSIAAAGTSEARSSVVEKGGNVLVVVGPNSSGVSLNLEDLEAAELYFSSWVGSIDAFSTMEFRNAVPKFFEIDGEYPTSLTLMPETFTGVSESSIISLIQSYSSRINGTLTSGTFRDDLQTLGLEDPYLTYNGESLRFQINCSEMEYPTFRLTGYDTGIGESAISGFSTETDIIGYLDRLNAKATNLSLVKIPELENSVITANLEPERLDTDLNRLELVILDLSDSLVTPTTFINSFNNSIADILGDTLMTAEELKSAGLLKGSITPLPTQEIEAALSAYKLADNGLEEVERSVIEIRETFQNELDLFEGTVSSLSGRVYDAEVSGQELKVLVEASSVTISNLNSYADNVIDSFLTEADFTEMIEGIEGAVSPYEISPELLATINNAPESISLLDVGLESLKEKVDQVNYDLTTAEERSSVIDSEIKDLSDKADASVEWTSDVNGYINDVLEGELPTDAQIEAVEGAGIVDIDLNYMTTIADAQASAVTMGAEVISLQSDVTDTNVLIDIMEADIISAQADVTEVSQKSVEIQVTLDEYENYLLEISNSSVYSDAEITAILNNIEGEIV